METDTTTNSLSRLDSLTHCQMCLNAFQNPVTLSCGFTLCINCLPESNQCLSFSCLRTHPTIDHKPTILLENILSQFNPTLEFVADGSLKRLLDCSICLSTLSEPITTQCGHTFCKKCLIKTMTDMPTRCCPFCRTEINRIGKENQLINEWLNYLNNIESYYPNEDQSAGSSSDEEETLQQPQYSIPLIQVSSAVSFPTQHCLFRILDLQRILKRSARRGYRKLYAICVFTKPSTNDFYEHGVMLQIDHIEHIADIRHSVVQATGLFRLRVNHLTVDSNNCYTGDVVRLDDLVENSEDLTINRQLIEQTKNKRWTMPTTVIANTVSTPSTPTTSTSTVVTTAASQLHIPTTSRKMTRPRPCSMRLSSSAPNNFYLSHSDIYPGSRRPWGTIMNNKPSSPPPSFNTTVNNLAKKSQQQSPSKVPVLQQQPSRSSGTNTPTFTSLNELFDGELHPYIIHYLTNVGNEAWIMQYDWHLLNSNRNTVVWWVANVLPLEYNEKILLLSMETLRERMMALVAWADKGRSY